jgi:hypothetical protein
VEVGIMKAKFREWDEDGDGTVSIEEFKMAIKQLCGKKINDNEMRQLIKLTNTNEDDQVLACNATFTSLCHASANFDCILVTTSHGSVNLATIIQTGKFCDYAKLFIQSPFDKINQL